MTFSRIAMALLLGAVSTAAAAQDAPPHSYSYTGFRIEGQGGVDFTRAHLDYDLNGFTTDLGHADKTGAAYAVNVGYDVDVGGFLLGTEASFGDSTSKYCDTVFSLHSCLKFGREIEAGVRIGKVLGATGPLVYGKVAYVNSRQKISQDDAEDGTVFRAHDDQDGIRVGVGAEQKLTDRFYVKAEYRYTNFKDYKSVDDDGGTTRIDLSRHQVVGGVGVIF